MIVEPGGFRTEFCGDALPACVPLPDYAGTVGQMQTLMKGSDGEQTGDPVRAAQAILEAMASEHPPLRLPLGTDAVGMLQGTLEVRIAEIRAWESLSGSTDFPRISPAR
jgi:hypothetical protein